LRRWDPAGGATIGSESAMEDDMLAEHSSVIRAGVRRRGLVSMRRELSMHSGRRAGIQHRSSPLGQAERLGLGPGNVAHSFSAT
jgi:hypothetical protein